MLIDIETKLPQTITARQEPLIESRTTNHELRTTNLRVCFVTLGCKVNYTESEAIAQLFREAGYQVVGAAEEVEVVVVNTCTVTNVGDSKSRQVIRRMIRKHPESIVVVMGCYAQTAPGEVLGIDGVDLVLGTRERMKILDWLERVKAGGKAQNAVREIRAGEEFEELPQLREERRTRAFLKIQDGCNQFCTYCIIPLARGPSRSRLPENVLAEARRLVEAGYHEIVLTGIHTGYYGQDLGEELGAKEWDLDRLIGKLADLSGLKRLRLSSIEPMEYTPKLRESIASSDKVCPHVHMPLQSGSDRVLSKMNRPYTVNEYLELLGELRRRIPDVAVTTDIITGFPGETEEDHAATLEFVKSCGFTGINVFPYSKRKGTPAASYAGQVPNRIKERRVKDLLLLDRFSRKEFVRRFLGKQVEVLIEWIDAQGYAVGHTPHYLQVKIPAGSGQGVPWRPGQFVKLVLEEGMVADS